METPRPLAGDESALAGAERLTVRFGSHTVLDGVDLTLHAGEIVTLIGLNGSGKSTLARCLLGLQPASGGRVWRRPGLRVGYTPQQIALDPVLPLTVHRFLQLGGRRSREEAGAALHQVGVGDLGERQMIALSGGERQRVLLARALLRRPELLVLDEPMSGVDVAGQTELYRLIESLRDSLGCGVLLVSHELHVVMAATNRVVCLNHHVCCTGQPRAVLRDPAFARLFGRSTAEVLALYEHRHDHAHEPSGAVADAPPEEARAASGGAPH